MELRLSPTPAAPSDGGAETVVLGGQAVPVRWRSNRRARRITLSIDAGAGGVRITLPPRLSRARGLDFLEGQADWVLARLAALPARVAFVDGARVPLLGQELPLRHREEARRGVWLADGAINVSGPIAHFSRRVADWLKAEAGREARRRAEAKVLLLAALRREDGAPPARALGRVGVRDTRSRWGSCSARGNLSFSWRLVLCPEPVLDYVVAHEVAHLAEMNHGPEFWRLCTRLAGDVPGPRAWLRRNAGRLHRYG